MQKRPSLASIAKSLLAGGVAGELGLFSLSIQIMKGQGLLHPSQPMLTEGNAVAQVVCLVPLLLHLRG